MNVLSNNKQQVVNNLYISFIIAVIKWNGRLRRKAQSAIHKVTANVEDRCELIRQISQIVFVFCFAC